MMRWEFCIEVTSHQTSQQISLEVWGSCCAEASAIIIMMLKTAIAMEVTFSAPGWHFKYDLTKEYIIGKWCITVTQKIPNSLPKTTGCESFYLMRSRLWTDCCGKCTQHDPDFRLLLFLSFLKSWLLLRWFLFCFLSVSGVPRPCCLSVWWQKGSVSSVFVAFVGLVVDALSFFFTAALHKLILERDFHRYFRDNFINTINLYLMS